MRYYLIAGEASGDLHGSNLMKGLREEDPEAEFRFRGGDLMAAVGGTLVHHYKSTAVMGIVEVISRMGTIRRNLAECRRDLLEYDPDLLILIDYPGFNLKMARFAHRHGIRVFYYIAPKLWARGERRIRKIRRYVDELFVIFPFEKEYFRNLGVEAHYEGNPLIESIDAYKALHMGREEFTTRHSLADSPSIALLAGSRKVEISFLLPRMVAMERLLKQDPLLSGYQLLLAAAPSVDLQLYRSLIPADSSIRIVSDDTYGVLSHSEAAIISSGTASLEAALIGIPQVVCYGFNRITYLIARILVKVKYISLANLILDKLIFKELVQDDASPEKIFEEVLRLITDKEYKSDMKNDYAHLRDVLGGSGASRKIASNMITRINNKLNK
ncbi:MAG TPA: lipid-A-disaccharide synthase [Bacteroidales bacterium]|jgi:lipid-A-disaccharide synthase|nr:lipid-A-disaccharide synthase [Bacteroidales bacterium]